jgi:hypothetical protein
MRTMMMTMFMQAYLRWATHITRKRRHFLSASLRVRPWAFKSQDSPESKHCAFIWAFQRLGGVIF